MDVAASAFSCICVFVCACHVCALSSDSVDLETPFLVCRCIFRISRSSLYVKVTRTEKNHTSVTIYIHSQVVKSAFDRKAVLLQMRLHCC